MSKAMDDLRHEHEAILFSLTVLEEMAARAEAGEPLETGDALSLLAFLREFADKCHHGKEEGILFPALRRAGIAEEGGPIGVMLHEHDLGRRLIGGMEAALREGGDRRAFAREAREYIGLLRQHIDKENSVLFPLGEEMLDDSTLGSIWTRFEEHEEKVIGAGRHEQLHAMLDDFEKRYLSGR